MNGKAVVTGKVGLKLIYIDTDNMTNTISDNQSFSESFSDASITKDSYITLNNITIQNTVLSNDGILKVNCEVTLKPTMFLNLAVNTNLNTENLITKKSELKTSCISSNVNTNFDYTSNIETKDSISKILCNSSYFNLTDISPNEGTVTVEGKLHTCVLYEVLEDNNAKLKEIHDTFNLKTDVQINDVLPDSVLDLCFTIDKSKERITIEKDEDSNSIIIENNVKVCGVVIKELNVDIVDDAYSVVSEVETVSSSREYFKTIDTFTCSENIFGEISLSDEETAIDEILTNMNISTETTNVYIKNSTVYIEGIVNSTIAYIDENNEYKQKTTQIPFIINSNHNAESIACSSINVGIADYKFKVKRGTIIELEYTLNATLKIYQKDSIQMVDNVNFGKTLDFSNYDYQIYIAKPNESMWNLCKRIKCSLEDVINQNKNLPTQLIGGERIIIKR